MSGFYCPRCGRVQHVPAGLVTCQGCGSLGLRGYEAPPRRVHCPEEGCRWSGWDDGGVNNDMRRHQLRDHPMTPDRA